MPLMRILVLSILCGNASTVFPVKGFKKMMFELKIYDGEPLAKWFALEMHLTNSMQTTDLLTRKLTGRVLCLVAVLLIPNLSAITTCLQ